MALHKRVHLSRFAQLLLFSCLVLFLPTYLYLRPTSSLPSYHHVPPLHYGQTSQGAGAGGVHMGSQGWGPVAVEDELPGDSWRKVGVDPAKLKSGNFWKVGWKAPSGKGGGGPDKNHAAADATANEAAPMATLTAEDTIPGAVAGAHVPAADGAKAFAPLMGNATAKAELGRATWHFLHLLTLRFPDKPTPAQRTTLATFFHTFSLLYPCGECANHFQQLLKEMPPQTSSRISAALWLCAAHNRVNERLGKPEFPCDKLDESYDCGCGPDPLSSKTILQNPSLQTPQKKPGVDVAKPAALLSPRGNDEAIGDEWMQARSIDECRACRRTLVEG